MGLFRSAFLVASGVTGKITYDAFTAAGGEINFMPYAMATVMLFAIGSAGSGCSPQPKASVAMRVASGEITLDGAAEDRMQQVLERTGNKIEAIKLYRELTGCGLKEAKDIVEYIQEQHKEKR